MLKIPKRVTDEIPPINPKGHWYQITSQQLRNSLIVQLGFFVL